MLVEMLDFFWKMREGEELKAPRHASAAATRDYVTTRDIVPTLSFILLRESLSLLNWRSIARTSFAILVTRLQTILTRAEIAIAKYTLIFSMLAGAAVVLEAALRVLAISKRVGEVIVERVPLRLRILL
jgi:hypothetical protein